MSSRPRVLIVGGSETLLGAERRLRQRGLRVDRLPVLRYEPVPQERVRDAIARFGRYDVLLLTSREAVRVMDQAGALPRSSPGRSRTRILCGGPATARAVKEAGLRSAWTARSGVGGAVAASLSGSPPLRIVYPRSDRAGSGVRQMLERDGHRVLDLVAYRVRSRPEPGRSLARRVARADRILVTSPSALSFLRASLPRPGFERLRRCGAVVVLGLRSARSARGHGIRGVRVSPGVTDAAVASFLRRDLDRGR